MAEAQRSPVAKALYVAAGLLIWVATVLLRRLLLAAVCRNTQEPTTLGLGAAVSVAGAIACGWLIYYSLGRAQRPRGAVRDPGERTLHLAATVVATIGLLAILLNAVTHTLALHCGPAG